MAAAVAEHREDCAETDLPAANLAEMLLDAADTKG